MDWDDVRYFLALARQGSLSKVARGLRVNHATVARRVAALEEGLGRPLFDRRPEGYGLTAFGQQLMAEAEAMERAALALREKAGSDDGPQGLVRLTTIRTLADGFLVERMGELRLRHPAIDLELLAESRNVSLARHEADIALRLGRLEDSELIGRRLATIRFGFYADLAWRDGPEGSIPLIGYDAATAVQEASWLADHFAGRRFAFRTNSQLTQAAAARAGFGAAMLPGYLAAGDPRLVPVALGRAPPSRELWLLLRPDSARIARVRAVVDWLADLFRRESAPGGRFADA